MVMDAQGSRGKERPKWRLVDGIRDYLREMGVPGKEGQNWSTVLAHLDMNLT